MGTSHLDKDLAKYLPNATTARQLLTEETAAAQKPGGEPAGLPAVGVGAGAGVGAGVRAGGTRKRSGTAARRLRNLALCAAAALAVVAPLGVWIALDHEGGARSGESEGVGPSAEPETMAQAVEAAAAPGGSGTGGPSGAGAAAATSVGPLSTGVAPSGTASAAPSSSASEVPMASAAPAPTATPKGKLPKIEPTVAPKSGPTSAPPPMQHPTNEGPVGGPPEY